MFHLVYVSLPVPLRDSLPRRVRDYTRSHNYAQPVWIEAATAMSPQMKTLFRQSLVEYCSVDRHSKHMDNHAYPPKVS